jgi:hypothetical protein
LGGAAEALFKKLQPIEVGTVGARGRTCLLGEAREISTLQCSLGIHVILCEF